MDLSIEVQDEASIFFVVMGANVADHRVGRTFCYEMDRYPGFFFERNAKPTFPSPSREGRGQKKKDVTGIEKERSV